MYIKYVQATVHNKHIFLLQCQNFRKNNLILQAIKIALKILYIQLHLLYGLLRNRLYHLYREKR